LRHNFDLLTGSTSECAMKSTMYGRIYLATDQRHGIHGVTARFPGWQ
jgi:hypothetical protein